MGLFFYPANIFSTHPSPHIDNVLKPETPSATSSLPPSLKRRSGLENNTGALQLHISTENRGDFDELLRPIRAIMFMVYF